MSTQLDQIAAMTQDVREIKAAMKFMMKSSLNQLKDEWVDAQVVLQILHMSQRTLQTLRDNGTLPYSRINGKFYYKVSDIHELLESNYTRSKRK